MLRHLQRLPGAHQAGSGALRRDHRHGRDLPHADLQHHRPPPVAYSCAPASPPTKSPWLAGTQRRRRVHRPHLPRRGPLPVPPRSWCASWRTTARSPPSTWTWTAMPTMDVHFNPNGSVCAIEGITVPGRPRPRQDGPRRAHRRRPVSERGRLLRYEAVPVREEVL